MLFYKKGGSNDMIALSELLHKMKEELTKLSVPNELPTVPIKNIIRVGDVFTSALFEFFVMVEPFDDRVRKSLLIKG